MFLYSIYSSCVMHDDAEKRWIFSNCIFTSTQDPVNMSQSKHTEQHPIKDLDPRNYRNLAALNQANETMVAFMCQTVFDLITRWNG